MFLVLLMRANDTNFSCTPSIVLSVRPLVTAPRFPNVVDNTASTHDLMYFPFSPDTLTLKSTAHKGRQITNSRRPLRCQRVVDMRGNWRGYGSSGPSSSPATWRPGRQRASLALGCCTTRPAASSSTRNSGLCSTPYGCKWNFMRCAGLCGFG